MTHAAIGTNTNVKAEPFYFDCPVLQAKILSTTCDKGREVKSKYQDSSTKKCFKCKDHEEHKLNNQVSVAEYHSRVVSEMSTTPKTNVCRPHWRHVGRN